MSESKSGSFEDNAKEAALDYSDACGITAVQKDMMKLAFRGGSKWSLEYLAKGGEEFQKFWIHDRTHRNGTFSVFLMAEVNGQKVNPNALRVVDLEALAASNARNVILEQQNSDLKAALELINPQLKKIAEAYSELQAANTQLTAALEYYGNELNYTEEGQILEVGSANVELDNGRIAREVLQKIKGSR